MSKELAVVKKKPVVRKFRKQIPESHRGSADTRIRWLWNQRFGTLQTVWQESPDVQDKMAAQMLMQCIIEKDLGSIQMIFNRIEGGAQSDADVLESSTVRV